MKKITLLAIVFLTVSAAYAQYTVSAVKEWYAQKAQEFNLSSSDIQDIIITDQYTDQHIGVTHIYLRQVVNGIEIFNANSSMHINKAGNLISIQNAFVPDALSKINTMVPSIGVSAALTSAGNEVEMNLQPVLNKGDVPMQHNQVAFMDANVSPEPVKAKLFYVNTEEGLKLSYNVEVYNKTTNDWWNVRVNALNGEVLEKNNWTTHCSVSPQSFNHDASTATMMSESLVSSALNHTHAKKANAPVYNVFPLPVESPNHGVRAMVSGQENATASPYGWHDTDGVAGAEYKTTRGNNVFAKEDTLAGNNINGYSPNGGDSMVFDFPIDSTWMNPNSYLDASITNLFYWNNTIHDIFYQYGFNETSGNFQRNNYGKGGLANDQVLAEAQDGNGTSNANFSTPADGQSGRMQMYLWPVTPVTTPKMVITNSPVSNGSYTVTLSNFGSKRFPDITARVVWVRDSSTADTLGCNPLINASELAGNIALIQRGGTCTNTQKVLNAQNAGAIAVIVINTSTSTSALTGFNSNIIIPSVVVGSTDGAKIRSAMSNGDTVVATIKGLPTVKAYDSDFDNGVIVHEYGHGISTRLTGGPANSNCLSNAEQGGEGWSDFFALALTAKPGDSGTYARGMATFVNNQSPTALGIRDYRYSTSMKVNPMTYNYIRNNKGVHYVGTVWCTMLWDMFWNMVQKHGFDADVYNGTGGNNMAIQLVIDGLKLQPCRPGFVDARDAIIKADSIRYGGANHDLLWNTFARRGLGYGANQGSSNSVTDGVASFAIPEGVVGLTDVQNLARYIELSPNPTQGIVTIIMPDQLKEAQVTVFDIAGKIVFDENTRTDASQHIKLDMTDKQRGMYFVKISNGGTVFQSKLLLTN